MASISLSFLIFNGKIADYRHTTEVIESFVVPVNYCKTPDKYRPLPEFTRVSSTLTDAIIWDQHWPGTNDDTWPERRWSQMSATPMIMCPQKAPCTFSRKSVFGTVIFCRRNPEYFLLWFPGPESQWHQVFGHCWCLTHHGLDASCYYH